MHKQKKGFTLVELIVTITILSILGTIAFISLQQHSTSARDSKRVSDLSSLNTKIEIEANLKRTFPISNYIKNSFSGNTLADNTGVVFAGATSIINGSNYGVGELDFARLKESSDAFLDPKTNESYIFGYVSGTNINMYQLSSVLESTNTALINGNYFQMKPTDLVGLIKSKSNPLEIVQNRSAFLPYIVN